MILIPEHDSQQAARHAQQQVEALCPKRTDAHYKGDLADALVVVAVAIVVDDEQTVDDQSAGNGRYSDRRRDGMQLDIVGDADGDDAEEDQHEDVAQAQVGQVGGVEKAKGYAADADQNHFGTAEDDKGQTYHTRHACG